MLGLSRKTGWSVRRTRTVLEVLVLIVGWMGDEPHFYCEGMPKELGRVRVF